MKILELYETVCLRLEKARKEKEILSSKTITSKVFYSLSLWKFCAYAIKAVAIIFGDSSQNFLLFTRLDKDSVIACNNSYCQYKKMERRVRFLSKIAFALVLISTIITSSVLYFLMPGKPIGHAATNNWNQTDWSLGADIAALANHIANQTGWQKFYSKNANVIVDYGGDGGTAGEVKLSVTTSGITETTTADFSAGTQSNTGAVSNSVLLLKPLGSSCVATSECIANPGTVCLGSPTVCSNGYVYTTQCAGINIYYADLGATYTWKTTNTACDTPQCGINGAQDGDNLVDPIANSGVDFSLYPSQNACKAIGGRLPTKTELACIYTNRATMGTFQANYYWSSTEYNAAAAWIQHFGNGVVTYNSKAISYYVRCVRGQ